MLFTNISCCYNKIVLTQNHFLDSKLETISNWLTLDSTNLPNHFFLALHPLYTYIYRSGLPFETELQAGDIIASSQCNNRYCQRVHGWHWELFWILFYHNFFFIWISQFCSCKWFSCGLKSKHILQGYVLCMYSSTFISCFFCIFYCQFSILYIY